MNKLLAVIVILAVGTVGSAYGATTTYRIVDYPNDEGGFSQSAAATPSLPYSYIVTDGTIGQLTQADILGGDWAYRNPNATSGIATIASGVSGATTFFDDVVATPTELLLPTGGTLAFGVGDVLQYDNFGNDFPSFSCYATNPVRYAWNTSNPTMNGSQPWVVAVVVPEPATLALSCVGGVLPVGLGVWRRHRRRRR